MTGHSRSVFYSALKTSGHVLSTSVIKGCVKDFDGLGWVWEFISAFIISPWTNIKTLMCHFFLHAGLPTASLLRFSSRSSWSLYMYTFILKGFPNLLLEEKDATHVKTHLYISQRVLPNIWLTVKLVMRGTLKGHYGISQPHYAL